MYNKLTVCDCGCHNKESGLDMVHVNPCCMKCLICGNNIKINDFDEHLIDCTNFYTELIKKRKKTSQD